MTQMRTGSILGNAVRRVEDPDLVVGAGDYVDDLRVDGTLQAIFVRSPFAHARITRVDTGEAEASPGAQPVNGVKPIGDWTIRGQFTVPFPTAIENVQFVPSRLRHGIPDPEPWRSNLRKLSPPLRCGGPALSPAARAASVRVAGQGETNAGLGTNATGCRETGRVTLTLQPGSVRGASND